MSCVLHKPTLNDFSLADRLSESCVLYKSILNDLSLTDRLLVGCVLYKPVLNDLSLTSRMCIVSVPPVAAADAAPVYSRIILYEVNSLYSVTLYCCELSLMLYMYRTNRLSR